jgi:hypothetical protein
MSDPAMNPLRGIRRGQKYTVYTNGSVYEAEKYKFTIEDKSILSYIDSKSWLTKTMKIHLDNLLDGYPESFNFLSELRETINAIAPHLHDDIAQEMKDKMANTHRLMDLPIKKRIEELLQVSRNGNLYDYHHFKQARWTIVIEALSILFKNKKTNVKLRKKKLVR